MALKKQNGLTSLQEKAAHLIAIGTKVQDVAEKVGVDRVTIWNWKKGSHFLAFLNCLRNEYRESSQSKILALHDQAKETLTRCLNSENETVALKAALAVLDRVENIPEEEINPRQIELSQLKLNNDLELQQLLYPPTNFANSTRGTTGGSTG